MTQAVSNTNIAFAGQALKYMQNGSLKERSLFDDVKSSAVGAIPFALVLDTVPTLLGAKKIKKNNAGMTFKDALNKKTEERLKSQNTQTYGRVAKFLRLDKLGNWYANTALGKTKFGGLFKGASSGFIMTGIMELMEVIPAFKNGGFASGMKQVAKSSANVVVDGLMYTAGAKIGAMAGAALGPVGAVVGGIGGTILGGILNTIGRRALDKVLGKNYSEKKQEQDMQTQAQQIAQDDAQLAEMKNAVEAQIVQKAQSGKKLTDDDKQMLALAQAVDVDDTQSSNADSAQTLDAAQSAQMNATQGIAETNATETAQAQNVNMTPEEQEEAELIARLQKVNNPQIDYQIPSDFSINA